MSEPSDDSDTESGSEASGLYPPYPIPAGHSHSHKGSSRQGSIAGHVTEEELWDLAY